MRQAITGARQSCRRGALAKSRKQSLVRRMGTNKIINMELQIEKSLVEQIRVIHGIAQDAALNARHHAGNAIRAAYDCGKLLHKARAKLAHGEWLNWIEANLPEMSQRTVYNYIKLSNLHHVANLDDYPSLRQAYIAAGILPEPDTVLSTEPISQKPIYLSNIKKTRSSLEKVEICGLDEMAKEELRGELKPLVDFYGQL